MACPGGTSQKVLLNASTVGTPGELLHQYYWILCVIRYEYIWFRGENLNGFLDIRTFKN